MDLSFFLLRITRFSGLRLGDPSLREEKIQDGARGQQWHSSLMGGDCLAQRESRRVESSPMMVDSVESCP
jgi:hypothetical protein